MVISKNEAWQKVQKLDISIAKKEIIFFNIFEYELKIFMETKKNSKLLKILVTILVCNSLLLDDIKKVLVDKSSVKNYHNMHKIGQIDNNNILYIIQK